MAHDSGVAGAVTAADHVGDAGRSPLLPAVLEMAGVAVVWLLCTWWLTPLALAGGGGAAVFGLVATGLAVYVVAASAAGCRGGGGLAAAGVGPWRKGLVRTDNLGPACRDVAWVTVAGTVLLLSWCAWCRPGAWAGTDWEAFGVKYVLYHLSALAQAWLYFGFYAVRLRRCLEGRVARPGVGVVLGTAAVVAMFHLPNLPLMAAVAFGAVGWGWAFQRHPNLLPIVLSHAWLATLLHRGVGLHFRIGYFFWHPDQHVMRAFLPGLDAYLRTLW